MSSHISYKFKSSLTFDTIQFEGDSILVKNFNVIVKRKCGLGAIDCDLKLQDTNGICYLRDDDAIPAGSKIIIRRVPKMRNSMKKLPESISKVSQCKPVNKLENQSSTKTSPPSSNNFPGMQSTSNDSFSNLCNSLGKPPASYICHRCDRTGEHWMQFCDKEEVVPEMKSDNQSLKTLLSLIDTAKMKGNLTIQPDKTVPDESFIESPDSPEKIMDENECQKDTSFSSLASKSPSYVSEIGSPNDSCKLDYSETVSLNDPADTEIFESDTVEEIVASSPNPPDETLLSMNRDPRQLPYKVPSTFLCPICDKILRDAVLVRCCTATFCRTCISSEQRNDVIIECPSCQKKFSNSTKEISVLDNVVVRNMIVEWQRKMLDASHNQTVQAQNHQSAVAELNDEEMNPSEFQVNLLTDSDEEMPICLDKEMSETISDSDNCQKISSEEAPDQRQNTNSEKTQNIKVIGENPEADENESKSSSISHENEPIEEDQRTEMQRPSSTDHQMENSMEKDEAQFGHSQQNKTHNGFPVPVLPLSTNIHQSNPTFSLYNYYFQGGAYGAPQDHGYVGSHNAANRSMPPTPYDMQSYAMNMSGMPAGMMYPSTSTASNYPNYSGGWNHILTSVPPPGYNTTLPNQMTGLNNHYRLPTDSSNNPLSDRYDQRRENDAKQYRYRPNSSYKSWQLKDGNSNQTKINNVFTSSSTHDKSDNRKRIFCKDKYKIDNKKDSNLGRFPADSENNYSKDSDLVGNSENLETARGESTENTHKSGHDSYSGSKVSRHSNLSRTEESGKIDPKSSTSCDVSALENQPFSPALYLKCMKVLFKTDKTKFDSLFSSTIGHRIEVRERNNASDSESSESEIEALSSVVASQSLTRLVSERSKLSSSPRCRPESFEPRSQYDRQTYECRGAAHDYSTRSPTGTPSRHGSERRLKRSPPYSSHGGSFHHHNLHHRSSHQQTPNYSHSDSRGKLNSSRGLRPTTLKHFYMNRRSGVRKTAK